MKLLGRLLIQTVAIYVAALIVPGVSISGLLPSLIVALVLALLNATLGLLLKILTLPINLLTLGLLGFVINVIMIMLSAEIVHGFAIRGFFPAAIFAIILSLVNYVLHQAFAEEARG